MFTLVKELGLHETIKREFIPLASSFLIAEIYYKFHSFTLECIAFLATWVILSYLQSLIAAKKA